MPRIFADGVSPDHYDATRDIDLSHWVPNQTPEEYKADSSTEICMNFAEYGPIANYSLVLNNHLDTDGLLSVFSLLYPKFALKYKKLIIEVAEAGDFWSGLSLRGAKVYETLVVWTEKLLKGHTQQETYVILMERLPHLLEAPDKFEAIWKEGVENFQHSQTLLNEGSISREEFGDIVCYTIPQTLDEIHTQSGDPRMSFSSSLTFQTTLLPQVMNSQDGERITLIATEMDKGYRYDLQYPWYVWAETPNRWIPPDLRFKPSKRGTDEVGLSNSELEVAVAELNTHEANDGEWILADTLQFKGVPGRGFPVALSFMKEETAAVSSISPSEVIEILDPCFNEAVAHKA